MKSSMFLRLRGNHYARLLCPSLLILLTVAVAWLFAHEGHAPLPTKGVQVDVEKGRLVLAASSRTALDVQVATVETRASGEKILSYVTLVAPWQNHAYVTSQLPGRIVRLHKRSGQLVQADDLIAEVHSPQLEELRLEMLATKTSLELSQKTLAALKQNVASVAGQVLQEAETKYQQDVNAVEVARNKWASLGLDASVLAPSSGTGESARPLTLPVRSPIDGVIIHTDLTVGQVIEPSEHLVEIVNLQKVWARIDVLEKDMPKVAIGQEVQVSLAAHPGETFATTVQLQSFALDPVTLLASYWGELRNADVNAPRFLPGMKGQAYLQVEHNKKAKVIPSNALIDDGLDRYVLVEEASTTGASEYQKKSVIVVHRSQDWVEIQSEDIFPGDRVVTRGAHELGTYFVPGVLRLSPQSERTIGIKVEPVQQQIVEDVIEVHGAVEVPADRRSFASLQIEGTMQKLHVERGQAVMQGQMLGEAASLEFQKLQLDLLKEALEYQLLDKQYLALKDLDQVVSRLRLLQLDNSRSASHNRKEATRNRLAMLGMSREQLEELVELKKLTKLLPIRATISGTLVHFDQALGQAVKANEKLFTLHNLNKPLIEAYVPERDLSSIRIGEAQPVRVRFANDPITFFTGKVTRSGNMFGTDSHTLSVWVELEQYPKAPLLHKQSARLSIGVRQHPAKLAVPATAVIYEGSTAFVFVQREDGRFERAEVTTGRSDDRFVEIRHGLEVGQRVVVRGVSDLQTAHAVLR